MPITWMASWAALATSGSSLRANGRRSATTSGSPMLPRTEITIGTCLPSFSASPNRGSARRPALVSRIPAIVRTSSSSAARASIRTRPAASIPVTPHTAFEANSRAAAPIFIPRLAIRLAQMPFGACATFSLELLRNRMTFPYTRVPRRSVTEPHWEDVLLDSTVAKPLTASIGQDYKIEARTHRHHLLRVSKVGRVSSVHWTTRQNKLFHFQSERSRDHCNAATLPPAAVCEHVIQTLPANPPQ